MLFSRFKWNDKVLELDEASSAYVYYRRKRVNLITGFPESYSLENFFQELEGIALQDHFKTPKVFHFHYELGLILAGLGHSVTDETPLAVAIEYRKHRKRAPRRSRLGQIHLRNIERPSWTEYKGAFNYVQEQLLEGNCYQVNLTYPFDFITEELLDPRDVSDFFMSRRGLGAFAHITYMGESMIVSNTPECLFQWRGKELVTMPIKGTVKRRKDWRAQWQELIQDEKQEGELLMIVDLLRNDLNRLETPRAQVKRLKVPLLVPGLLHQYALLSVEIERQLSLLKTFNGMFPGGSVTGAPKKRVMEIIQRVERWQRGIYCGSTLLCWEHSKSASINIRTAAFYPEERLWRYGAGGGITLLSRAVDEFQEMEAKVSSFLTLLKTPGY